MAITMTRAEYEKKYGVKPVVPTTPRKMTRAEYETEFLSKAKKTLNYKQRVIEGFSGIGKDVVSGIKQGAKAYQTGAKKGTLKGEFQATGGLLRAGLRTAGGVARGAFTPILEAPIIKQVTEAVVGRVAEIPVAQSLIRTATDLAIKYPNASKDLRDIVDIASLGVGGGIEKPLLRETRAIGRDVVAGTKVILTPSEEAVQSKVLNLFQKSIKPTAKKTISQGEKYNKDTLNALRAIKTNADKLNIEDATGELISARTPQTINELAQGIEQTKQIVFSQYDDLAKRAGSAGANINTQTIADEVARVAQNKALQLTNPSIVQYAKSWEQRLREFDVLDSETAQEVVKMMNTNLKAFYNNPTYEAASKVTIDAGIANNIRGALDNAIETATGEQYQILKRQYGALKAIENDVARAAMREGRKNTKGLLDYTDILTGGQMITGILSLNPGMFTKGAIERGIKEYIKFLNDPNRAVANMFEKLSIDTSAGFEPLSATGKYLKNPKMGMSIEDVSKRSNASNLPTTGLKTQQKGLQTSTNPTTLSDKIQATGEQKPTIKLKRDVTITTLQGEKVTIPEDEVLKAYESGGKALLKDGREYIVSKSQYENIKNNSLKSEAKEFAPELKGTEESITGGAKKQLEWTQEKNGDFNTSFNGKDISITPEGSKFYVYEKGGRLGKTVDSLSDAKRNAQMYVDQSQAVTKYSSYQLPEGKDYKEILIKAPTSKDAKISYNLEEYNKFPKEVTEVFEKAGDDSEAVIKGLQKLGYEVDYDPASFDVYGFYKSTKEAPIFKSSHWDEPNVISHLRLNERTYKGKKVTFVEELQSDWAREARSKGFSPEKQARITELENGTNLTPREMAELTRLVADKKLATPTNPLLKNWQELSVKRALKEAVDNDSKYLAWISGEQTSARYNLATHVKNVDWMPATPLRAGEKYKIITLNPNSGGELQMSINAEGKIVETIGRTDASWKGKKLDEVLGKGLADKIMEKETGQLSGEGLAFGGEWAKNLYDKQVKNIVEDITGHKVEVIDMGLPIEKEKIDFSIRIKSGPNVGVRKNLTKENLKVGLNVEERVSGKSYIITDILGDGKFKAVPKSKFTADTAKPFIRNGKKVSMAEFYDPMAETFDISTKKSTGQQAIKITDEIRALVKGVAPKLK